MVLRVDSWEEMWCRKVMSMCRHQCWFRFLESKLALVFLYIHTCNFCLIHICGVVTSSVTVILLYLVVRSSYSLANNANSSPSIIMNSLSEMGEDAGDTVSIAVLVCIQWLCPVPVQ